MSSKKVRMSLIAVVLMVTGLSLTACDGSQRQVASSPQNECPSCEEIEQPFVEGLWSEASGMSYRAFPAAVLQLDLKLYAGSSAPTSQGIVPVPNDLLSLDVKGRLTVQSLQLYCPNSFLWFDTWYLISSPAGTYEATRTLQAGTVTSGTSFEGAQVEFKSGWHTLIVEFDKMRLNPADGLSGYITLRDLYGGCQVSVNLEPNYVLGAYQSPQDN